MRDFVFIEQGFETNPVNPYRKDQLDALLVHLVGS